MHSGKRNKSAALRADNSMTDNEIQRNVDKLTVADDVLDANFGNINLLKAAPELLELLKEAREAIEIQGDNVYLIVQIDHLIAKVEGRRPNA